MANSRKTWKWSPRAWFKDLKALHKILIGFSIIIVGMMAIGLIGLMGLAIGEQDEVQVSCQGPDADAALQALLSALATALPDDHHAQAPVSTAAPKRPAEAGVLHGVCAAPGLVAGPLFRLNAITLPADAGHHVIGRVVTARLLERAAAREERVDRRTERPDLAAEGLGVPPRHPDFVLEDDCALVSSRRPGSVVPGQARCPAP